MVFLVDEDEYPAVLLLVLQGVVVKASCAAELATDVCLALLHRAGPRERTEVVRLSAKGV